MIRLGSFDTTVAADNINQYKELVKKATRVSLDEVKDGTDKADFHAVSPDGKVDMSVKEVQQALIDLGFFPGGDADGICGYRTLSAIRLFQEYVRSVEGLDSVPDGIFGPNAQGHLKRWLKEGKRPHWENTISKWKSGNTAGTEYQQWLSLLEKVKNKQSTQPHPLVDKLNKYSGKSDSKKVSEWDFGSDKMHLIGIRRDEYSGKFDDAFIFLIKGLVFKFQGSTEPGASSSSKGTPFLVPGQHDYHFGWHQRKYLALRPQSMFTDGVLVLRSKNDKKLDASDLANDLEANGSINIHWGGKGWGDQGQAFDVNSWSEGCQVITGTFYANPENELVSCKDFVATRNSEVSGGKTRGAYNVLLDLATALGSDIEGNVIKYTLLNEEDLELDPILQKGLEDAKAAAASAIS